MNYPAEQHRSRTEEYTVDRNKETADQALDEFFTALGNREGLELLDTEENGQETEYSFQAANSSAQASYSAEGLEGRTEVSIEFYGAAPLVDRLYNSFSAERPGKFHETV